MLGRGRQWADVEAEEKLLHQLVDDPVAEAAGEPRGHEAGELLGEEGERGVTRLAVAVGVPAFDPLDRAGPFISGIVARHGLSRGIALSGLGPGPGGGFGTVPSAGARPYHEELEAKPPRSSPPTDAHPVALRGRGIGSQ